MSSAFLSSFSSFPLRTIARTAARTLDVLIGFLHRRPLHNDTSASASASAEDGEEEDLLSRFLRISKRFPKPNPNPNANPNPNPPLLDSFDYNSLMKSFSRANQPDQVLRLFQEMKLSNILPNRHCYTTAINALASAGRFVEAESMFHDMISSGISPDAIAFSVLLKMYAFHLQDFDLAFELIRYMVDSGCDPDVVTYSTLIASLCRARRVEDAWKVLDRMLGEQCRPNCHSYTPILRFYCHEGRIDEARKLLERMEMLGCSPDSVCYNVLVDGLCRTGDFGGVEDLFRVENWVPDDVSYNTFINGLCKAGRVDEGFRQLELMLGKGLSPTTVTLNILLDCLCRESKVSEVSGLMDRSCELGLDVDVLSYNIVMSRLCSAREWSAVWKHFTDMLKKGVAPNTWSFNILIDSFCKSGRYRKAKCVYDGRGFVRDVVTCNILIHGMFMAGTTSEIDLLFSDMKKERIAPDTTTYNLMVDCLCRDNRFSEAIYLVRTLKGSISQEPLAHLTFGLVRGGRLSDLLRLFEEMLDKGWIPDSQVYAFLISAFCQKGSCNSKEIYKICFVLERMLGVE